MSPLHQLVMKMPLSDNACLQSAKNPGLTKSSIICSPSKPSVRMMSVPPRRVLTYCAPSASTISNVSPSNGSSNRPRATAMTFGLISTAVWRQSGRQASIQRANEPPPSPICVMWTGGSANSSQAIIARLYDKTSSVGLSRFIELWMVSLPRWRERMLPVSEMPTSGMAGRAGRRRW